MATEMTGKTVLVTGANSGIGFEASVKLARMGAEVVMVARDPKKGDAALAEVKARSGSQKVSLLVHDLGSMAGVRALAAAFRAKHARLDVLVNNAGSVSEKHQLTVDGYEQTFAVNHLAGFLLTSLLLDLLKKSAPSRIVNVASRGHFQGTMDFANLHYENGGYFIMKAYGRSKLANVLHAAELARRLTGTGVTAYSLHPGAVATNIWGHAPRWSQPILNLAKRLFMITPEQGGDTIVHAATSDDVLPHNGRYFVNKKPTPTSVLARDETLAKRLWETSEKLTAL